MQYHIDYILDSLITQLAPYLDTILFNYFNLVLSISLTKARNLRWTDITVNKPWQGTQGSPQDRNGIFREVIISIEKQ